MKKACPICGKKVAVVDPYKNEAIKRASAWFATHRKPGTRTECDGSRMTAIDRHPQPESEPADLSRYAMKEFPRREVPPRVERQPYPEGMEEMVLGKTAERERKK